MDAKYSAVNSAIQTLEPSCLAFLLDSVYPARPIELTLSEMTNLCVNAIKGACMKAIKFYKVLETMPKRSCAYKLSLALTRAMASPTAMNTSASPVRSEQVGTLPLLAGKASKISKKHTFFERETGQMNCREISENGSPACTRV